MDTDFEQKIRERAYHIWMAAGMDDGKAHDHWVMAERAVTCEAPKAGKSTQVAEASKSTKTAKPAKKPAKKSAKKSARTVAAETAMKSSTATH
jgi:Protein of unknown function (DUF2934).